MLHKAAFFRVIAIPACMVWGVMEFFALQRSRLLSRRGHFSNLAGQTAVTRNEQALSSTD